jgi:hypothetical protein
MIESMATGTPVVAYRAGAVPEIILPEVTGYVCETFGAMVDAVPRVQRLDRAACRAHVEQRFSATAMADAYEYAYRRLVPGGCGEHRKSLARELAGRAGARFGRLAASANVSPPLRTRADVDRVWPSPYQPVPTREQNS